MNFKTMSIDDIIDWCIANKQVDWLKAKSAEKRPCKVYPRIKVDGKVITDKTATPKIEKRPITFIQLKMDFVETFMPEIAPKAKEKAPTMYDRIKAL